MSNAFSGWKWPVILAAVHAAGKSIIDNPAYSSEQKIAGTRLTEWGKRVNSNFYKLTVRLNLKAP